MINTRNFRRPLACEDGKFYWNLMRVPKTLPDGQTPHPSRTCAIFVVHGIGDQVWTATAASLRSGFEDAMDGIRKWQEREEARKKMEDTSVRQRLRRLLKMFHRGQAKDECKKNPERDIHSSPFIYEGYWADYDDVQKTFPEDCAKFCEREKGFFSRLWNQRAVSAAKTVAWYLNQQRRLLSFRIFRQNPIAWFIYLPLQVLFPITLGFGLLRYPKIISGYLGDVRMYVDPRGDVERAIAQRIDKRVGTAFLSMIGLDWDFRRLLPGSCIEAGGDRVTFERVVWVAHSLGTVISYNVLSSLFHRAEELEAYGDDEQQEGVKRFRTSLVRFITLGSPLNKIAYLFGDKCLIPWPDGSRRCLLEGGEMVEPGMGSQGKEWWINFYHVFDPVSGVLKNEKFYSETPPINFHVWSLSSWIPGYSHVTYWTDQRSLRFILGRTYGSKYLKHDAYRQPMSPFMLSLIGFSVWAFILFGGLYALTKYVPPYVIPWIKSFVKKSLGLS